MKSYKSCILYTHVLIRKKICGLKLYATWEKYDLALCDMFHSLACYKDQWKRFENWQNYFTWEVSHLNYSLFTFRSCRKYSQEVTLSQIFNFCMLVGRFSVYRRQTGINLHAGSYQTGNLAMGYKSSYSPVIRFPWQCDM